MDNTLFLGNGLFRLKTECEKRIGCAGRDKSWGDLLSEIAYLAQDASDSSLPAPVDYDRMLAIIEKNRHELEEYYGLRPGLNDRWKQALREEDLEHGIKRYIADWFNERSYCAPEILDRVLGLDFDYLLTSNYDLRIETHLESRKKLPHSPKLINSYGLLAGEKESGLVGHVHGSISDIDSIVIGQSDYLKSSSAIDELINQWDGSLFDAERVEWPLLFLTTNVFVLGFGYGFDEVDLWHLLHLRAMWMSRHPEYERNHIRYYSLYTSGGSSLRVSNPRQHRLFAAYDVEVIDVPVLQNNYEDAYIAAIDLFMDHVKKSSVANETEKV